MPLNGRATLVFATSRLRLSQRKLHITHPYLMRAVVRRSVHPVCLSPLLAKLMVCLKQETFEKIPPEYFGTGPSHAGVVTTPRLVELYATTDSRSRSDPLASSLSALSSPADEAPCFLSLPAAWCQAMFDCLLILLHRLYRFGYFHGEAFAVDGVATLHARRLLCSYKKSTYLALQYSPVWPHLL